MINISLIARTIGSLVLVSAVGMAATISAWAQSAGPSVANSIEAINVAGQQGGNIVVPLPSKSR